MILSVETHPLLERYGDRKAIELIANAGFDAIDYSQFALRTDESHPVLSANYEKYAHELKTFANGKGVYFNQSHAPFPSFLESDTKYSETIFERIKRSIEFAALLGAKQICVHPITFPNNEDRELEFNLEFYNKLIPCAKQFGIKIGVENMFWRDTTARALRPGACGTSQRMIKLFDMLDPRYFTCLLDIGHSGLVGEKPENFIKALGHDRLGALHVHDNDHKNDMHTIPFSQSIEWKDVTEALADIEYAGDFTFETSLFPGRYPDEFVPEAMSFLCKTGRLLISMIENHKK
ncbi:MAG: sugar phosphate isomerase/epimerase [Clostridia bacterium]|nr:sugar phosphate isomerase/epimerase [Clostridia bacterium]